jgi:hypothetical protein
MWTDDTAETIRRMWGDNATWREDMIYGGVGQTWVPRLAANRGQV